MGALNMPLFVSMRRGTTLDEGLKERIRTRLKSAYSPRHVPDAIFPVEGIPYTISGKKMELPVKKLLMGVAPERAYKRATVRNPEALDFFLRFAQSPEKGCLS